MCICLAFPTRGCWTIATYYLSNSRRRSAICSGQIAAFSGIIASSFRDTEAKVVQPGPWRARIQRGSPAYHPPWVGGVRPVLKKDGGGVAGDLPVSTVLIAPEISCVAMTPPPCFAGSRRDALPGRAWADYLHGDFSGNGAAPGVSRRAMALFCQIIIIMVKRMPTSKRAVFLTP